MLRRCHGADEVRPDGTCEVSYRWVEHTGELELGIKAPTGRAVFVDALQAFAELLGDDGRGDRFAHEIRVDGREHAVLLLEWLDELVYLAERRILCQRRWQGSSSPTAALSRRCAVIAAARATW